LIANAAAKSCLFTCNELLGFVAKEEIEWLAHRGRVYPLPRYWAPSRVKNRTGAIPRMSIADKALPSFLSFEFDSRKDFLVVHLRGRASFDQMPILDRCVEAIQANAQPRILLDLSDLTYIGSAGLGAFITLKKAVETHQRRIVLAGLNPLVLDLFETSGLTRHFTVFDTPQEALA
jgi:anti-sigma B factor antagonist